MEETNIVIYQSDDGITKIETLLENETVWLTQEQMAALFGKGRSTITEHIGNVFKEGELEEHVVCRDFRHTTQHGAIAGKTQEKITKYYNLDVIISVGYRVKSLQGTRFRQWATARLREYIVKGFTVNDVLLKQGGGQVVMDVRRKATRVVSAVYPDQNCRGSQTSSNLAGRSPLRPQGFGWWNSH